MRTARSRGRDHSPARQGEPHRTSAACGDAGIRRCRWDRYMQHAEPAGDRACGVLVDDPGRRPLAARRQGEGERGGDEEGIPPARAPRTSRGQQRRGALCKLLSAAIRRRRAPPRRARPHVFHLLQRVRLPAGRRQTQLSATAGCSQRSARWRAPPQPARVKGISTRFSSPTPSVNPIVAPAAAAPSFCTATVVPRVSA